MPLFCAVLLSSVSPQDASPEVIVHDLIGVQGEEVVIKVETRGKFFSRGGEIVQLFIDGRSAGNILSGGDGFAFRRYTAGKTGLHRVEARSVADEGFGFVLTLKKGTGIVFVDLAGSLFEGPFSANPKKGSVEVLREINRRFPVVFLASGMIGTRAAKVWLKKSGYLELPVIPWDDGKIFGDTYEKGLRIRAIIGSPEMILSAREYHPRAFSFTETEDAREVRDWEEIGKILRSGGF